MNLQKAVPHCPLILNAYSCLDHDDEDEEEDDDDFVSILDY